MNQLLPQHVFAQQLEQFLGPALLGLVRRAATLAEGRGLALYVVGGTVRDMLLGRPHTDLDLVVEGDAIALAGALAAETGGTVQSHAPFGTATLAISLDVELDFATARREVYVHPAALPQPTPSDLADDLRRRDFSVNALALCLNHARFGELIDLHGGLHDLEQRQLRVLHDGSFIDDPTRMLRAARFAGRLGFAVEPHTTALAVAALSHDMFERTSPQRLANELRLLFHEPQPERSIAVLHHWGALPHLLPGLAWSATQAAQLAAARQHAWPAVSLARLHFALALYPLHASQRAALIARYQPATSIMRLLQDLDRLHARMPEVHAATSNSQIDQALRGIDDIALRAAQIAEPAPVPERIAHYFDQLRAMTVALDGNDLLALGVGRGPQIGRLLAALRAARLDGVVVSREEQAAWLRQRIAGE